MFCLFVFKYVQLPGGSFFTVHSSVQTHKPSAASQKWKDASHKILGNCNENAIRVSKTFQGDCVNA